MAKDRRSFFHRLTGAMDVDDEYNFDYAAEEDNIAAERKTVAPEKAIAEEEVEVPEEEGQLTVDVYQTDDYIVIKAVVAGVKPDKLDVSITRDMVTIHGSREESREATEEDYFYKELYWGSFSRTILLPQEIEVDEAEANEKHGVLTIRLPKIDKARQTKLKVKNG